MASSNSKNVCYHAPTLYNVNDKVVSVFMGFVFPDGVNLKSWERDPITDKLYFEVVPAGATTSVIVSDSLIDFPSSAFKAKLALLS